MWRALKQRTLDLVWPDLLPSSIALLGSPPPKEIAVARVGDREPVVAVSVSRRARKRRPTSGRETGSYAGIQDEASSVWRALRGEVESLGEEGRPKSADLTAATPDKPCVRARSVALLSQRERLFQQLYVSVTIGRVGEGFNTLPVGTLTSTGAPRKDVPKECQDRRIGRVRDCSGYRDFEEVLSSQTFRLAVAEELHTLIESVGGESVIPPVGSDALVVETVLEDILLSAPESASHITR